MIKNTLFFFLSLLVGVLQAQHITIESGANIKADSGVTIFLANTDLANAGTIQLKDGASLIQSAVAPSNSGNGTYTVEKVGSGYDRVYNYWSSPVMGILHNDAFPQASSMNMYEFDGTTQSWVVSNGSATLEAGTGYIATGAGTLPGVTFTRAFSNTTGFHSGNINFTLAYNDDGGGNSDTGNDWNLIGNPYPSGISVSDFLTDNSGVIDNAIYLWNSSGNDTGGTGADYATMNAAGVTGAGGGDMPTSNNIASCQGFLVRAIAAGDVTFQNSHRVGMNNTFLRTKKDDWHRVWLKVTHKMGYDNELLIGIIPDAKIGQDRYDAMKLEGSQHLSLYMAHGVDGQDFSTQNPLPNQNDKLVIQGLPSFSDNQIIPLGLNVKTAGPYRFDISHLDNFPTDKYRVYLKDNELGIITDLRNDTYEVNLPVKEYTQRFQLQFIADRVAGEIEELEANDPLKIYSYEKEVYLHLHQSPKSLSKITISDVSGKIYLEEEMNIGQGRNIIPMQQVSSGVYFVRVENEWGTEVERVLLID